MRTSPSYIRRTLLVLSGVLFSYGILVATHQGEFWPFSIYQMFSSAGQPWARTLVVEMPPGHPVSQRSQVVSEDRLPGPVFPLDYADIEQNDLSAFLARRNEWTSENLNQLRMLFTAPLESGKRLLFYRVSGTLANDGEVSIEHIPAIYLSSDTLITISEQDYW